MDRWERLQERKDSNSKINFHFVGGEMLTNLIGWERIFFMSKIATPPLRSCFTICLVAVAPVFHIRGLAKSPRMSGATCAAQNPTGTVLTPRLMHKVVWSDLIYSVCPVVVVVIHFFLTLVVP